MTQDNENAKDPKHKPPVELPGIIPGDYRHEIEDGKREPGFEEGNSKRQSTTSIVARVS